MASSSPAGSENDATTKTSPAPRSALSALDTSGVDAPLINIAINDNTTSKSLDPSKSSAQANQDPRPASTAFPQFHSHLEYALVRDFAYPAFTPLHYGPHDEPSGPTTPSSESYPRRYSEPETNWDEPKSKWKGSWPQIEKLPGMTYGEKDGPPWSEDEDLQSPVVTSVRHRKNKDERRGSYTGTNGDGSETYYVGNTDDLANGPGGEYITYPPAPPQTQPTSGSLSVAESTRRRDSHFAAVLPPRTFDDHSEPQSFSSSSPDDHWDDTDDSRFSRDYQFTIVSPEEEMHGKAVALFDFARENENELPLSEGQIVLVSYRHGEGWLVAQDPKSGESGLIPEEYVRLLRDIEGGWNGLMNGAGQYAMGPGDIDTSEAKTPTQETTGHSRKESKEYYTPVVSTFSTSRDDFKEPWARDKITSPSTNTPTELSRRGSEELKRTDLKKPDIELANSS